MSKSKLDKEIPVISGIFLSDKESDKAGYDDPDYVVYDDIEVAEVIIIPIEENAIGKRKKERRETLKMNISSDVVLEFLKTLGFIFTLLGERTEAVIKSVLSSVFVFVKIPAVFVWQKIILSLAASIKTRASRTAKRVKLHDYKKFHEDAKNTLKNLHEKDNMAERREAFKNNITASFTKHRRVWLTVANTLFPVACLIVLIVTLTHYDHLTYALKVNYNGEFIGYVSSEDVFNTAKDKAIERLSTGSDSNVSISAPTYSVTMLTPNKLSDSKKICDKIIEHTEGDYVNACGIYIDGEFVCAVKNETDAVNVFDKILEPYAKKAGKDATVAFVQEIKYVQGFYSDSKDAIWDSGKLEAEMNSSKSGAVYYTVKDGDSPLSIASANNIRYSELLKLNPNLEKGNIHVGEKILLSAQVNNIRVKVMKTETRTVSIPYESETKESATIYKGQQKTVQQGQNGQEKITELVTYIDGVKTYATTLSTVTTKRPVKEIIYKGTKEEFVAPRPSTGTGGYSGGGYSGGGSPSYTPSTSGTYGSPMASSYYVSSSYGGRTVYGRYNFHRGVDLCHAGGSAGIPVLSVASGTVVSAQYHSSWGYTVLIRHANGVQTRYAHMQAGSICVRAGQSVSKGQQIGRVGSTGHSTGNHLHFEVTKNGSLVSPYPYIGR